MGDWYCGEYFTYIKIWGNNSPHLLSKIVPEGMILVEVTYQIAMDGIHDRHTSLKGIHIPNSPLLGTLIYSKFLPCLSVNTQIKGIEVRKGY